ncbi:hypothetical protein H6G17_08420 [Chroococcidiopsis sp. FACHB-1243]|uniref:hypothetical protein n=1 Tax=Chroococcidiopsis sp. [FACHB-1243] TaxID=2692781 RepID=UPI001786B983|nr:hypothetical protein [Chroococcidiopsis sp. [FACHB-1243]]MBD2305538.1 hypothetical protein [Chroococcidiopsis sp. [FACHB-1243]]
MSKFKQWIALAAIVASILIGFHTISSPTIAQIPDTPDEHGMRVVGNHKIYLSHMGIFKDYPTTNHDYQALFEVIFVGKDNPQAKYLSDQKQDATKNEYTLEPTEHFLLSDLAAGKRKSFKANIYRGQYERPELNPIGLVSNATVNVKRVIYFKRFDPQAKLPSNLEYLLFGDRSEQYVAHVLTKPRDFDQILAVKTPLNLTNAELAKTVSLTFPERPTPNEPALANMVLKANNGEQYQVLVGDAAKPQQIELATEYFLESIDYCGKEGCQPLL